LIKRWRKIHKILHEEAVDVCACVCYKLSEEALFTLSMDAQGRMLGVGLQNGSVTLIAPSESLVELQEQERSVVSAVRVHYPPCVTCPCSPMVKPLGRHVQ